MYTLHECSSYVQKEKYCLVSASIQSPWVEKWLHPVISTSALGRLSTHSSPKTTSHPFHPPVLVLTSQILMKIIDVYCPIQCSCDNLLQKTFPVIPSISLVFYVCWLTSSKNFGKDSHEKKLIYISIGKKPRQQQF